AYTNNDQLSAAPLAQRVSALPAVKINGLRAGKPMVWRDRGELTPAKVYWGAPGAAEPQSRLPAPPFSKFKPIAKTRESRNPKARVTDSKGVEWTIKFGIEAR